MIGRAPPADEVGIASPDLDGPESPSESHDPLRAHVHDRARLEIESRVANGLGFIWMALGVVSMAISTWLGHPTLLALGFILFAVPSAWILSLRHLVPKLSVTRVAPARVHEGVEVTVELRIENRARITCFFPRLSEIFPPEIHAQKDLILTDRLLPGETATVRYAGYAILPRGVYTIGPSVLRVSDPFGWFEVRRKLDPRGELIVYPSIHELVPLEEGGDAVTAILEQLASPDIGDDDEMRGVREYRRGDSIRRIHWPLTARHRVPVVKEFQPIVAGDLHCILDLDRRSIAGLGRTSTIETAIRITASVANQSLALGHRVALLPGPERTQWLPLTGGDGTMRTILDTLVQLRPSDGPTLDDWLGDALSSIGRGGTALVFLAPALFRPGKSLTAIAEAVGRGVHVIATVFDERTYSQLRSDARPELSLSAILAALHRAGARTIVVPCASELETTFVLEREVSP